MSEAIAAAGLVKTFGATRALDGVDLTVHRGEVHGLVGPNGAGKTTMIRIMLGLIRADAGRVRLLGGDPWEEATALRRHLAYVPGDVTLWPGLTGGEVIDLICGMRGGLDRARRAELIECFGLDPRKKCRAYTEGERQKVALVAALASDAELLVFDEPTSYLDPLTEKTFRQVILEEQERANQTVLLCSHMMSQVEALCDRVSFIRAGRTVDTGTLAEMRLAARTSISARLAGRPLELVHMHGVQNVTVCDDHVQCEVDRDEVPEVLRYFTSIGVRDLTSRLPSLEELFLRRYGMRRGRAEHRCHQDTSEPA